MRIHLNLPSNAVASGEHGNGVWHISIQTIAILMAITVSNAALGQDGLVEVVPTQVAVANTTTTGSGVITLGAESYQVVNASDFAVTTGSGITQEGHVAQVGCQSCQTPKK